MTHARKNVEEAAVPLSAMIDVVFLLLIYFIVTQKPLTADVLLSSDLVGSPIIYSAPERVPFNITVSENTYMLDGRKLSHDQLQERLEATPRETTIVIRVSPNSHHEKLVGLLDILQLLDFKKLNLIDDCSVEFQK